MSDDIYNENGGFQNYKRGPILDKDGRYVVPVDHDTIETICPFCQQHWENPPHVALSTDDQILWVEGVWLRVRRKIPLRLLPVLMDSFGRFITRDQLVDLAYSDVSDADMPDIPSITTAIGWLRELIEPTTLTIQNRPGYGYRLTTKANANEFDRLEREQAERLAAAQSELRRSERAAKLSSERARSRKSRTRRDRERDLHALLGAVEKDKSRRH